MLERITENISLIRVKFHNIHTSVFLIKLDTGYAVFDAGTTDSDVAEIIMPAIFMAGINPIMVRFLFISHTHSDHFGGAKALLSRLPEARLVMCDTERAVKDGLSPRLFFGDASEYSPLRVIELSGHERGCLALLDTRTRTLLSGDAVQLYGISRWGTGVSEVDGYFKTLDTLSAMDIDTLVTSHEYYPFGQIASGREAISRYLAASREALLELIALVSASDASPDETAKAITEAKRKTEPNFPAQQVGTIKAIHKYLKSAVG